MNEPVALAPHSQLKLLKLLRFVFYRQQYWGESTFGGSLHLRCLPEVSHVKMRSMKSMRERNRGRMIKGSHVIVQDTIQTHTKPFRKL